LLSNKTDVNIKQEEKVTHEVTQQKNTEAKKQKIANLEGFWTKRGWRSVAMGKEHYSALCRAARSAGALVTLSQGRQGIKVPKMSRKIKNCYLNSTTMLNVTR
jgi:polyribonucleotide nucleotidyltransferase